nr:reverse transcriptase domain-containing protein [Tanacetum cinerariifolium]
MLAAPKPQEELIMYLSATHGAISSVLLTERGRIQTPVYFISRVLQGLELNYSPMEKLVLSLVFAAKRLRRYFQAHPIAIITDQPIKQVMSRPDAAGRLQEWSIMLGEHNITYRPRTYISHGDLRRTMDAVHGWLVVCRWVRRGTHIDKHRRGRIHLRAKVQFAASNNEAEYEALIAGLQIVTQMGVKNIQENVDSKLVANQVLGTYVAKEDNMIKYLEIANGLVSGFKTFSISQVLRCKNKKADALSKIASTSFAHLSKQVLVEVLKTKSITGKEVTAVIEEEGPTWMTELVNYLKEGTLPGDEKEARKIRLKARQYEVMEEVLYKRSFLTPWLRCVGPLQAEYVMKEIREGSCSMHAGPRSLSGRAVESQVPDRRNGLLHEMDRSKSGEIISDNGKQFADNPFKDWCDKLNITQHFASVKHPQSNGLVEKVNRSLGEGIKARLGEGNKNWVEELPHVLWAHRTMVKSSHDDTPFSLTYGTEAVIPAKIGMPTYRTTAVDVVNNDKELRLNLDLLEERRELAAINEASNDASHAAAGGKLGPKWEGPYEVTDALGNGAYKLRSMDGTILPRT